MTNEDINKLKLLSKYVSVLLVLFSIIPLFKIGWAINFTMGKPVGPFGFSLSDRFGFCLVSISFLLMVIFIIYAAILSEKNLKYTSMLAEKILDEEIKSEEAKNKILLEILNKKGFKPKQPLEKMPKLKRLALSMWYEKKHQQRNK